jgi:L-fuculose-phosphate aldolase
VFNVVLSLKFDRIEPLDLEAKIYFGHIPVVEGFFGTKELAEKIATAIKGRGAVIVKGHGIYAAGENLRDAFNKAAYVEHSCEVKYRSLVLDKL